MKVEELIKLLQTLPQDYTVYFEFDKIGIGIYGIVDVYHDKRKSVHIK